MIPMKKKLCLQLSYLIHLSESGISGSPQNERQADSDRSSGAIINRRLQSTFSGLVNNIFLM